MAKTETFLYVQSNQLEYPSLSIDKQSRTVTFASELQDETVLLDGVLQLSDFKSTFEFSIMGRIVSELLQGINSSLILIGGQNSNISDIIQGGESGLSHNYGVFQSIVSGLLGEGRKLTLTAIEVYGDVVRDMIEPTKQLTILDSLIGVEITGLSKYKIGSTTDIAQAMKTIQGHQFKSANDDSKCWVIYNLDMVQTKLDNQVVESQLKIISTCALEYAAIDQTKLVLAHGIAHLPQISSFTFYIGQLLAESLFSFFECVNDPSILFTTNSLLLNLLEAEIGGNTSTRWLGVLDETNLESQQANFLFRLFKKAQKIINHPILNAREYKINRKRDLQRYQSRNGITTEEEKNFRNQQREKDLISRINLLIQSSSHIQSQIQSAKKQVIESRKKYLDAQLEKSQMSDELDHANEIIQEYKDKEKISLRVASEKSGLQKKIAALNDRMESKMQELNFYINTLLNANLFYKDQIKDANHQIDLLMKHNTFLQSRYWIGNKEPSHEGHHHITHHIHPMSNSENEKELAVLYEKHHKLHEEYRKRTLESLEKLRNQMSSEEANHLANHFQNELLQSYIDHELDLLGQINALKNGESLVGSSLLSSHTHELLKKELREFMRTTQMELEREKYALLAKCSALEEESK